MVHEEVMRLLPEKQKHRVKPVWHQAARRGRAGGGWGGKPASLLLAARNEADRVRGQGAEDQAVVGPLNRRPKCTLHGRTLHRNVPSAF